MENRRIVIHVSVILAVVITIGYTFYTNLFSVTNDQGQMDVAIPTFAFTDMYGNQVDLADYKGQGIYLSFWSVY